MSETTAAPSRRVLYIVLGAIAALLVVVVILLVVLLNTMNAQARQQTFEDCMARQGHAADAPPPAVEGDDELRRYVDDLADAAEFCDR